MFNKGVSPPVEAGAGLFTYTAQALAAGPVSVSIPNAGVRSFSNPHTKRTEMIQYPGKLSLYFIVKSYIYKLVT